MVVCLKAAGVLSTDEPGGMPSRIRAALGDAAATVLTVHRLDRVVGGVMVFARTHRAASDLSKQLQAHTFKKIYLAVVQGAPPEAAGIMQDFLLRDGTQRKTHTASREAPGAQAASLEYTLCETIGNLSLLRIALQTGRTHQIRAQLSSRGIPILGDKKYGAAETDEPIALWSHGVQFLHPRTLEPLRFSAPPPTRAPWAQFYSEGFNFTSTML